MLSPRLSSYWVALVTPVETGLVRPLVDGLKTEMVVERRRPQGSTTRRSASTTPCARRSRRHDEPPQRPPGAPDRRRGDPRSRGAHGDGRARRRALDPGRRRHRPGRRARGALERDPPRAPGAHVLEVPLARDARADPRHLHRHGAARGAAVPAVRAAALRRPRVRGHARKRRRALAHHRRPAGLQARAQRRRLPRDRRAPLPGRGGGLGDRRTSRSRSRASTPRSRPG